MATKGPLMKQSIFSGHRLSFEYNLKKFIFGAWTIAFVPLRELVLSTVLPRISSAFLTNYNVSYLILLAKLAEKHGIFFLL